MKKKFKKIAGLTLIEILIAVVISSLMMAAMFTSYTIVNNTYRQVTDRAKLSQAGRDLIGQLLREIRMAGYKHVNDDMAPDNDHVAIKITKGSGLEGGTCDKIKLSMEVLTTLQLQLKEKDTNIQDTKLRMNVKNQLKLKLCQMDQNKQ